MSLNIGDNFSYLGKKFLDARQSFDTLEAMNSCKDVPEGFITICYEDNKRYEFRNGDWKEYIVDTDSGGSTGSGEGMTDEEREALNKKFDDVTAETITDENNNELTQLTFYSDGTEMKSVQFKGGNGGSTGTSNIDMDDIVYYGTEEPTNDNVIWFVPDSAIQSDVSYDNPIIMELMSIIRDMQSQITQLQADVEYLKTHGGGSGGGTTDPVVPTYSYLVLEDGSKLLLETGDGILLEEQNITTNSSYLLLEDGFKLLLETGDGILLEQQEITNNSSCFLLETGDRMLLESGDRMLLEA